MTIAVFFCTVSAFVPWMHHVLIIQKCKTIEDANL